MNNITTSPILTSNDDKNQEPQTNLKNASTNDLVQQVDNNNTNSKNHCNNRTMITLISKDNVSFRIKKSAAMLSDLVRGSLGMDDEDQDNDDIDDDNNNNDCNDDADGNVNNKKSDTIVIPVLRVNSYCLQYVIHFLNYYDTYEKMNPIPKLLNGRTFEDIIQQDYYRTYISNCLAEQKQKQTQQNQQQQQSQEQEQKNQKQQMDTKMISSSQQQPPETIVTSTLNHLNGAMIENTTITNDAARIPSDINDPNHHHEARDTLQQNHPSSNNNINEQHDPTTNNNHMNHSTTYDDSMLIHEYYDPKDDLIHRKIVFQLLSAADYMNIQPLLELICLWMSFKLMNRSAEEIRIFLNLPRLTAEDEVRARQDHPWMFEDT